jgi:hypothetical protein
MKPGAENGGFDMGFFAKWSVRLIALASFVGIAMWSWSVYKHNDLELGALAFGAAMVGRSTLLAWLRRHDDVGTFFRTKATAFIKSPLQEFAFIAPLYAAPAVWSQYGVMKTLIFVPIAWVVLRGLVRLIVAKTGGKTFAG